MKKVLKQYAKENNIEAVKIVLHDNASEIRKISDNKDKIIDIFYPCYSIAYDHGYVNFCAVYEKELNKLTGLDSALFHDDEL